MYKENLVKINHSILELICASSLISRGYAVEVEKDVSDILVCDVYAKKDVEVLLLRLKPVLLLQNMLWILLIILPQEL